MAMIARNNMPSRNSREVLTLSSISLPGTLLVNAVNGNLEEVGCRLLTKQLSRRLNFMVYIFGEAVFSVYSAKAEMCKGVSTRDCLWKS